MGRGVGVGSVTLMRARGCLWARKQVQGRGQGGPVYEVAVSGSDAAFVSG